MKQLEGVRVLVVDDDADTRDMLAIILELHGAAVETAASANDGLRLVATARHNVILCDITLPDADGYEFLVRARKIQGDVAVHVPAIALTGRALEDDRAKAIAAGFSLHLVKPVAPDVLVAKIGEIVDRSVN